LLLKITKSPYFLSSGWKVSDSYTEYSRSDDFDITPTLKELQNIDNIIWINQTNEVRIMRQLSGNFLINDLKITEYADLLERGIIL